jgi:hypothetical protein
MRLKLDIDIDAIAAQFKEFELEVKQDLNKAVANLAQVTHAKVVEMATNELHSSRKKFLDNLEIEEVVPGIWMVSVDENGLWVEEGIEPNTDMKPGLLKDGAKTSSEGHKYKVIPFDHTRPPSQMSATAQNIVSALKTALKSQNVSFKGIERNSDGSPRIGKIRTLNLGGQVPGRGNTGALQGVNIYQTVTKTGNVRKDIMTFRTVSSGPGSEGKFVHPGLEAKKFLDKALVWAEEIFDTQILPEIMNKWTS